VEKIRQNQDYLVTAKHFTNTAVDVMCSPTKGKG